MKKFIKQFIFFCLIASSTSFILFILTSEITEENANFKISDKTQYIIFGHSHPECAYNDSLIKNFKNFSSSGESYFYTYYKVKNIIEQNPNLEVVFIEFTNNQVWKGMDDWIWGDKYMSHRLPVFEPFISCDDKKFLLENNQDTYIRSLSVAFRTQLGRLLLHDYNFLKYGQYKHLDRNITDKISNFDDKQQSEIRETSNEMDNISHYNISYLNKIISFCRSKNKRIYFIRTPQHENYKKQINDELFFKVKDKYFSEIELLDLDEFPIQDSEFADFEHLNYLGASKLSIWFNSLLNHKLILSKKDKQKFINKEIANLKSNSDNLVLKDNHR